MAFANHAINWTAIAHAQKMYQGFGYEPVEVPWLVGDEAINATLPGGATPYIVQTGDSLVGSAEQSFVDLMVNGLLKPGNYQATTPCFRNDPVDEIHQKYFMKVELIRYFNRPLTENQVNDEMFEIISGAQTFFGHYLPIVMSIETPEGEDIVDTEFKIELGSYGVRTYKDHTWIYGTGVAEPRLSQVMAKYKGKTWD